MVMAKRDGHEEQEAPDAAADQPAEDTLSAPSLLELLLAQAPVAPPKLAARIDGVVTGHVARIDASGVVRVAFAGAPEEGFPARLATPVTSDDEGREVALMFEEGDPRRPIVMGKMVSPLAAGSTEAAADGRRVEINAEEEIVLRCGESSITLTRAGKIIIRGAYVLSRSSGVNRIQGGSVEIN